MGGVRLLLLDLLRYADPLEFLLDALYVALEPFDATGCLLKLLLSRLDLRLRFAQLALQRQRAARALLAAAHGAAVIAHAVRQQEVQLRKLGRETLRRCTVRGQIRLPQPRQTFKRRVAEAVGEP